MVSLASAKLLRMTADPMRQFGEHLRTLRKARRLSQNELAERAGVNEKYLGEIERGVGNPSLEVLMKLAKAMDIDAATVVGDDLVHMARTELLGVAQRQLEALGDAELRTVIRSLRLGLTRTR